MDLSVALRDYATSAGADYFGVADLAPAKAFIQVHGGDRIARYPRAVSIGIGLLDSLVDLLPEREDFSAAHLYKHNAYDAVNLDLDRISLAVAKIIQKNGFQALPVPAAKRANDEKIAAVFSHKLAAHLAGLGWIGKSCLLITPDRGPRVRWVTVLTDAPIEPTGTAMAQQCGECTQCTDVCPSGSITGRAFDKAEPREFRLDAGTCQRYYFSMEKSRGIAVCGMCLYVCPHGRKGK